MSRPLIALDAVSPGAILEAIRAALSGDGPAVLPFEPGRHPGTLPAEVAQGVALVIETSGSSGSPKRVTLGTDALLASAAASDAALGASGRWLLALPAHYIAGANVLIRSIVAGTEPIIAVSGAFDTDRFVTAIGKFGDEPAYTSLVPVQLDRLVAAATDSARVADALRRFDRILVGGQSVPGALIARAGALGLRVTRTYGSSETAGGCVYDGVTIGTALARTEDGEILISGPMLAEGYLGDPARTEAAFVMADGRRWYRTGDAGDVVDGRVDVTGRLDNVIISGGLKVALDQVERITRAIPGLADAIVVPADSHEWGQVPVIVTTGTAPLDEVRSVVCAALGRAAAPARIVRCDQIPRLASGKPDLPALRVLAIGPD